MEDNNSDCTVVAADRQLVVVNDFKDVAEDLERPKMKKIPTIIAGTLTAIGACGVFASIKYPEITTGIVSSLDLGSEILPARLTSILTTAGGILTFLLASGAGKQLEYDDKIRKASDEAEKVIKLANRPIEDIISEAEIELDNLKKNGHALLYEFGDAATRVETIGNRMGKNSIALMEVNKTLQELKSQIIASDEVLVSDNEEIPVVVSKAQPLAVPA